MQRWGKGEARCEGLLGHGKIAPAPWTVEGIGWVKKNGQGAAGRWERPEVEDNGESAARRGKCHGRERWTSCWLEEEEGGAGWNFLGAMDQSSPTPWLADGEELLRAGCCVWEKKAGKRKWRLGKMQGWE